MVNRPTAYRATAMARHYSDNIDMNSTNVAQGIADDTFTTRIAFYSNPNENVCNSCHRLPTGYIGISRRIFNISPQKINQILRIMGAS